MNAVPRKVKTERTKKNLTKVSTKKLDKQQFRKPIISFHLLQLKKLQNYEKGFIMDRKTKSMFIQKSTWWMEDRGKVIRGNAKLIQTIKKKKKKDSTYLIIYRWA